MTTDMSGNEANGARANGPEGPWSLTDEQMAAAQVNAQRNAQTDADSQIDTPRNAQIDTKGDVLSNEQIEDKGIAWERDQSKKEILVYRGNQYDDGDDRQAAERIIAARSASGSQPEEALTYRGIRYSGERYAPERIRITKKSRSALAQWFNNLPVADKQLAGLLASKMLSVLGVIGVSLLLLSATGRRLILNQAASELSATAKNLTREVAAPGLSEGILLEAAESSSELDSPDEIDESLAQATRSNLRARLETNQLEYIALVDTDFRVVASGNTARTSDVFNPNNLVSNALRQREPQAALSLQTIAELRQQGISVPSTVNEAALVRYVATPIFPAGSPLDETGVPVQPVGALIEGDIINRDAPIVVDTLTAFPAGYTEIYLQEPSGSFDLVALAESGEVLSGRRNGGTYDYDFLDQTIRAASDGQAPSAISERFKQPNGDRYTVAATAIVDGNGKAVGVIQRGLPERALQTWQRNATGLLIGAALLALLADVIIARLLGRSIVKPLRRLQEATEEFASGDRATRAEVFSRDEVGRVASAFNELAASVATSELSLRFQSESQTESARRARSLSELTSQIRQTLETPAIFATSVERAREVLEVDRVIIYRFNADYTGGEVTAESLGKGWIRSQGQYLEDPMLPDSVDRFMTGQVSAINNIETADLTECHCRLLRELEVKANMVAPVIVGDTLVGLICAHQCSGPRQWQPEELNMMQQIATQVGYALSQAQLLETQRQAIKQEQQLAALVTAIRATSTSGAAPIDTRDKIFRIVTRQVKIALETSRVIIYLFDQNWKGTVVAESVDPQWTPALGAEIADPCFAETYVEQYRTGRVKATTNIYEAGLTDCHLQQLEPYQVRANLVAPIVVEDRLLGLLIAHECARPREWSTTTINFIQRAATQLGYALEQAEATLQKETALARAETLSEERLRRQEQLQEQLIDLLSDVEAVADGDLTVRANVSTGEIGTVADFFNAIVESLRAIVTQVKRSANRVNDSLGQNESAIRLLAEDALQQAEQTTLTLDSVEAMTASIQQVAHRAKEAATVARNASETATSGEEAMDLTVNNIMNLRQTVGLTAKKVKRLGESSQQITKAVSLINQISQQTNLLAINAGIEAARAGEEGQGFAAVAEEVGELASRSASATEEIERIVETIQRETSEVVEAIEQSTTQVVEGTRRVEDARTSLGQILAGSQQMDELARSISQETSSQVQTSTLVSSLIEEIAQLAKRTSTSSKQVSEALNQTVTVAQDLQSQVATFVVDSVADAKEANRG
ncbi:MAG: GAF domain-containing protein [Cyanobacteria bacterium P01_D01_bin.1]